MPAFAQWQEEEGTATWNFVRFYNTVTSHHVLIVALLKWPEGLDDSEHFHGDWAVYTDGVPGKCHEDEWQAVLDRGDKLDEERARYFMPEIARIADEHKVPYRR